MSQFATYVKAVATSRSDLAKEMGISRPYLSLILTGRRRPSLELAIRIERLTDGAVPVSSWIANEPNPETEDTA